MHLLPKRLIPALLLQPNMHQQQRKLCVLTGRGVTIGVPAASRRSPALPLITNHPSQQSRRSRSLAEAIKAFQAIQHHRSNPTQDKHTDNDKANIPEVVVQVADKIPRAATKLKLLSNQANYLDTADR